MHSFPSKSKQANFRSSLVCNLLIFAFNLQCLVSCSLRESREDLQESIEAPTVSSRFSGLLFAASDIFYESGSLYYYDFTNGKIDGLLYGQGGDAKIFQDRGRYFYFNRTSTSYNYRELKYIRGSWEIGSQISYPKAAKGDPHGFLLLDEERALVSNFSNSDISILHLPSGATEELQFEWNLRGSPFFRPGALYRLDSRIAVLHQAWSQNFMEVGGAGQLFFIDNSTSRFEPIDLDDSTNAVDGVALPLSFPTYLETEGDGRLVVSGFCTRLTAECEQGSAIVDLATNLSSPRWQATSSPYFTVSELLRSNVGGSIYAVLEKSNKEGFSSGVFQINLNSGAAAEIPNFQSISQGIWAFLFDFSSNRIIAGTPLSRNEGLLTLRSVQDAPTISVRLPAIPQSGVFVSAP